MRILLVTHLLPPEGNAGVENYVVNLARELSSSHDVTVLSGTRNRAAQPLVIAEVGPRLRHITLNAGGAGRWPGGQYANERCDGIVRTFLESERFDIVHIAHLMGLSVDLIRIFKREFSLPVVLTLNDYWYLCYRVQMLTTSGAPCPHPSESRCISCALGKRAPSAPRWLVETVASAIVAAKPLLSMMSASLDDRKMKSPPTPLRTWGHPCSGRGVSPCSKVIPPLKKGEMKGDFIFEALNYFSVRASHIADLLNSDADLIIAPSEFIAKRHIDAETAGRRMRIMPYGIPLPRAKVRFNPKPVFGFVGMLALHKGSELLFEAFGRLPDVEFRLVGDIPDQATAARLARYRNVAHLGAVRNDAISSVFDEFDCLVVPSIWEENLPIIILEALAAGLPVIAARVGGIPELIRDRTNGMLFTRGDRDGFVRTLKLVSGDSNLFNELILGARSGRGGITSIGTHAEELGDIYGRLVSRSTPANEGSTR